MVQEQLVSMPASERSKMLLALFGLMPAEERAELEKKLSRTKISISRELEGENGASPGSGSEGARGEI